MPLSNNHSLTALSVDLLFIHITSPYRSPLGTWLLPAIAEASLASLKISRSGNDSMLCPSMVAVMLVALMLQTKFAHSDGARIGACEVAGRP